MTSWKLYLWFSHHKLVSKSLNPSSRWWFLDVRVETDYTHANSQQTSKLRPVNSRAVVSTYEMHGCTCLYLYTPPRLKRTWSWGRLVYHGQQNLLKTSTVMSWKKPTVPLHGKRFARLTSINREVTCPNLIQGFKLLWLPKYYPHWVFTYVPFQCGELCAYFWSSDLMPSNDAVLPHWMFCDIRRERFGFWDQDTSSLTHPLPLLWKERAEVAVYHGSLHYPYFPSKS